MDDSHNFNEQNIALLKKAEEISSQLSLNLKEFYITKVEIRDEYKTLNNAEKVPYDDLCNANTFGSNNGFKSIVNALESLLNMINDFYDGDISSFRSDEMNNEIYQTTLNNISFDFEHICKWIGIEEDNKIKK